MTETVTQASRATMPAGGVTKVALTAGTVSSYIFTPPRCVIACTPGAGGTMLAEATWSPQADVVAGTANWHDWDVGTVSSADNQILEHATAVRFTATTQAGVGEVAA